MEPTAREQAISLILSGVDITLALLIASGGGEGPGVNRFVALPREISKIPDPRCVARRLVGIDPLTREAVEQALDACSA